jgi:sugar phosphate isomerase/epimerase
MLKHLRRHLMVAAGTAIWVLAMPSVAHAAGRTAHPRPMIEQSQIAVQLWSTRKYGGARGHVDYMLGKLKEIGFPAVELAGFWNLSGAEWKEMLDRHQLKVASVHTNQFELAAPGGMDKLIENMRQLGSQRVVYAYTTAEMETASARQTLIAQLAAYHQKFAEAGIEMHYHNHNMEFVKTEAGETAYAEMLRKVPMPVQLDVHWAARAGVNPEALIDELGARAKSLHMKDIGLDKAAAPDQPTVRSFLFREIGRGTLDWPAIIGAARRAGTEWYIVEQDANFIDDDPLTSLKASYEYLQKHFVRRGSAPRP